MSQKHIGIDSLLAESGRHGGTLLNELVGNDSGDGRRVFMLLSRRRRLGYLEGKKFPSTRSSDGSTCHPKRENYRVNQGWIPVDTLTWPSGPLLEGLRKTFDKAIEIWLPQWTTCSLRILIYKGTTARCCMEAWLPIREAAQKDS